MAEAELGDDVFGDDPTVIALEERAAELTGKQAGLFVASGTMGNLVSLMAHVPRGGEIIAGEGAHSFAHEAANYAVVVGASMKLLPWDDEGKMDLERIRRAFRNPLDTHDPITSLVMLENTHSDSMAQPLPADYVEFGGQDRPRRHGCRCTSTGPGSGTRRSRWACPLASCWPRPTRLRSACRRAWPARSDRSSSARRTSSGRRAGHARWSAAGMRQVGVLAAAGLIALRDGADGMIDRLAEDHINARRLADGLADLPGIVALEPARVRTNFVFFELSQPDLRMKFLDALSDEGVLMIDYPGGDRIRAVTHYGIDAADIDAAIGAVRRALHAVGLAPAVAATAA